MVRRLVWAIIVLGGLVFLWSLFAPQFRRQASLRKRRDELRGRVESEKAAIADLREKKRKFEENPKFVEHLARDAGFAKPGEVVVKLRVAGEDGE